MTTQTFIDAKEQLEIMKNKFFDEAIAEVERLEMIAGYEPHF